MRELQSQITAHVHGQPMIKSVYPYQIAFNCIPQIDSFGADGYTGEENKMMLESRFALTIRVKVPSGPTRWS